jgi:protein-S-isoprenylcysteine O-methyltransferase Ste14
MPRYRFPKPYADFAQRLRAPGGFLLAAAFAWWSAPDAASLALGASIASAGIGLRAWAAGHLAKNERLATGGPYAHTRNPLYIGTVIAAAGFAVAARQPWLGALFAAVFGLVYLPAIELEEQHLRKLFPEYADYARRTPRLGFRPGRGSGARFRWELYFRNEEYKAGAGFLAAVALLAWKVWR